MTDPREWLNFRADGTAIQLNISVRRDRAQALAEALERLKLNDLTASKSELVVEAIIDSAERLTRA